MAYHENAGRHGQPRHEGPERPDAPSIQATGRHRSPRPEERGSERGPEPGQDRARPGSAKPRPKPRPRPRDVVPPGYEGVAAHLSAEFGNLHPPGIVSRCVSAAQHSAEDITGTAGPDLVERIARKHLQILALVAAERRQQGTLRNAAT